MPSPDRIGRFRASLDALAPHGRVALAVSGGPDSVALLLLACAARPGSVVAATVDHGLRPEGPAEARFVASLCLRLSVPHATLGVTVSDDPAGLQAAARAARYAALAIWARQMEADALATAHHCDDQAETVLMRLARGAGVAGLSGIRRSRPLDDISGIMVIRPLLGWSKRELEAIVAEAGIDPVRDPSNADPRFDRTHARALLAGGWPDATRIAASAERLGEAEEALAWSASLLADERLFCAKDAVRIDVVGLPREHRRRLLLRAISSLAPDADPRGDALDRLLVALDSGVVATLAGLRCDPGPPWRIEHAPPRRSN